MTATDDDGCSGTATLTVSGSTTCAAPGIPTLTKAGHTYLDLAWGDSLPGSNYAYEIRRRISPNGAWSSDTLAPYIPVYYCGGPQNTVDPPAATRLNNLLPCTSYDIQVRKICSYGEPDESTTTWSGSATHSTKECGNAYYTANCHPVAQEPDWITISNFGFGPLQDTTGHCSACAGCGSTGDGYLYQSLLSFRIDTGQTYTAGYTVETGSQTTSGYLKIWLDLNLDLDFNDAGELLLNKPVTAGSPQSWPVTIPANASVGGSRMRVLLSPVSSSEPCAVFDAGAVRDYPVLLGLDCTGPPTANLTYTYNGLDYTFNNTSSGGTTYHWDFGDGNTSTALNPTHTYTAAGFYTLVLTVGNPCGTSTKTVLIHTVPTADFSADPFSGCATLTVGFTNASSSNATAFVWQFPGGQPASSNLANPIVQYQNAGTYTVTLTVLNGSGATTETKTDYIVVQNIPVADFTKSVNGLGVTFSNSSSGASSYLWNFGDGFTSIQANPVHTYQTGGTYTVMLTATNDCGSATTTQTVSLTGPPIASFIANPTSGCGPLTVQFTNTSSGIPSSYAWSFPGGSPSSSTLQNPAVVYNTPGTYTVTLTASNASGSNTASQVNFITVNAGPIAGFTSSVAGVVATFTNTTTNGVSYSWNFGDSQTSTAQNPSHAYTQDGTYSVTLTSTNPCGTSTASHVVVIVTPPTANFSATPATGCGPLTVQFTSTSSANSITYAWAFPGGTPSSSTAQNPTVVYNTPGVYTVSLTVSNNAGSNTATKTNFITVNPGPTAGFTSSVAGATATFTNTSVNGATYSWAFGNGQTSTAQNPSHTYINDGMYTVTLTATNACGTSTASQVVVIVTPPTANFSAAPATGCGPLTVQFSSTSSANSITYTWAFPGGTPSSSTAQNPTVVYNTPGVYTVSLTVGNNAGSNKATKTNFITVNPGPTAGFTNSVIGATATFNNTSVNGVTYSWAFGDGLTSTAQNPSHTYTSDGTYTVTLTATNACGTSTASQVVVIVTPPTANFSAAPATGCGPLTVQFTNTSSANTITYAWSFPGGNPSSSTAQNPTVVYNTPGVYTISLTVGNNAGSNTATKTNFITVNPGPTAGFTNSIAGAIATFTNTSVNGVTYSWAFGDGQTSTAQNPSHTYTSDGTYTVTLTTTNPCGTSTSSQVVVIATPPTANFSAAQATGCVPLTVQFTNTSSANTTGYAWSFPGGTPSSSTALNPVVAYNTPGAYTVTLTASNPAGSNTATKTNFITVNPGPTAGFTSFVAGATATFTNTSVNGVTYSWVFGDGQTSTAQNPSHTYTSDGTYTVTLTTTNACGTSTFSQAVTIATPFTANFSASDTGGCLPLTVKFINTSSASATNFYWSFPGGIPTSSTEKDPIVTYSADTGVYSVTLIASNGTSADTITLHDYISVRDVPFANFSFDITGLTVSFNNFSTGADGFIWNFGDGQTSTTLLPVHTYAAEGMYTAELTVYNTCGASTMQQHIYVYTSQPIANFTATPLSGCLPLTVQFSNTSSANTSDFYWSFPGGMPESSTEQHPVVTYNAPGIYPVELTASNTYGTVTKTDYITALIVPNTNFSIQVDGTNVTFINSSTGADANSYSWDFGDGQSGIEENPVHAYGTLGTYTVCLTAVNDCGANTVCQEIALSCIDVPEFDLGSDTFYCTGSSIILTVSNTSGSYQWSTGATSPDIVVDSPGSYRVTVTDSEGCAATDSIFVRVQDSIITILDVRICWGVSYTVCDQIFNSPGDYQIVCTSKATGCDSIIRLHLEVITDLYAVAYPDTFNLRANQDEATFAVAFNDSLSANSAWVVEILTDGQHGRANPEPDARVHYRLTDTDFHGIDSFVYEICNAACPDTCDTALAIVIIQNEIPNAFSPDDDGFNDTFDPLGWHLENDQPNPPPTAAALTVWNRWNEIVFHADPYPENGWDGSSATGKRVPQGTYFYLLQMTGGETERIRGAVHVLVSGK